MTITKPETLRIEIGSFRLRAVKQSGKWRFQCSRWPELAAQFDGAESAEPCKEAFQLRVLAARKRNKAEKLVSELQAHFDSSTPEEMVAWIADLVSMRPEIEKKNPKFYYTVFKAAVEKLYLKTLTGKW